MKNVVKKYRSLLTLILDILIIILGYIVAIVFLNTTVLETRAQTHK